MTHVSDYPYLEEVNDGILRRISRLAVPADGRVLDVGCGRGILGAALRDRGWSVCGIELHPVAVEGARKRLDRVIPADLGDFERVEAELGGERYDVLVFSDVLEHMPDPSGILRHYLRWLRPGGRVLVSVPNFVVWTNRLRLVAGVVAEHDSGVMDRTHLHVFSFATARRMVECAGLRVEGIDSTPHLARAFLPLIKCLLLPRGERSNPRALIETRLYRIYNRWIYRVERVLASLWRTLLAFRIVIVAVKPGENEHER
jgi:2-polyprenyl-3-methyl-5-hydroxy-6-metoxy-1,4-benzoquinol methylase